jgi:hypothetical protein
MNLNLDKSWNIRDNSYTYVLIQNGKDFTPISGDNFLGPLLNSSFFFKKGIHEYRIFSKYTKK